MRQRTSSGGVRADQVSINLTATTTNIACGTFFFHLPASSPFPSDRADFAVQCARRQQSRSPSGPHVFGPRSSTKPLGYFALNNTRRPTTRFLGRNYRPAFVIVNPSLAFDDSHGSPVSDTSRRTTLRFAFG